MAGKRFGGPWRDENGNYHASTQTVPKEILTGPKGGQYWIDEKGKKHYLKRSTESNTQRPTRFSDPSVISERDKSIRHCCCCGKELSISEMNYYDLTDYCPKCALADGIITSLD